MCQKVAHVSDLPGYFYLVSAGFIAIQIYVTVFNILVMQLYNTYANAIVYMSVV